MSDPLSYEPRRMPRPVYRSWRGVLLAISLAASFFAYGIAASGSGGWLPGEMSRFLVAASIAVMSCGLLAAMAYRRFRNARLGAGSVVLDILTLSLSLYHLVPAFGLALRQLRK